MKHFLNRKAIELSVNPAPLQSDNIRNSAYILRPPTAHCKPLALNVGTSEEIRKQSNCVRGQVKEGCEGKIKGAAPLCS